MAVKHSRGPCVAAAIAVGLLLVGCAAPVRQQPRSTPETVADAAGSSVMHVVQPGQTLWRIARAYGIDLESLCAANEIDDPTEIGQGRVLVIPGATAVLDVPAYPAEIPHHPRRLEARAASFRWPLPGGKIVSGFGAPRRGRLHHGIDIAATRGAAVLAAAAGRVEYVGNGMRGYGNTVIIDHGNGLRSLYAHNSRVLVRRGERVDPGQPVARVGRTGNATAEHCHFEIRKGGVPIDPLRYLAEPAR